MRKRERDKRTREREITNLERTVKSLIVLEQIAKVGHGGWQLHVTHGLGGLLLHQRLDVLVASTETLQVGRSVNLKNKLNKKMHFDQTNKVSKSCMCTLYIALPTSLSEAS